SRRPSIAPVRTPGRPRQRMTVPTAAPEPVNCSTNQSKAMMVNWSPRYEMLNPSQSRWNAGCRNGFASSKCCIIQWTIKLFRRYTKPRAVSTDCGSECDLDVTSGDECDAFGALLVLSGSASSPDL